MIHVSDLLVYDDTLDEGKAIGTAKMKDLVLKQDMLFPKHHNPVKLANERKKGQTVAKRVFDTATEETRKTFRKLVKNYYGGKVNEKALYTEATKIMKGAWKKVFLAGLRAGGTGGGGSGPGKSLVNLDTADEAWIKSAMQHEMRFLNGFLTAMVEDTTKMDPIRRADMYVDAMYSFFESARVISLPSNTRIWWKGPDDHKTCESCSYMFVNNPYTKLTLPTTPRSGLTLCLCLTDCHVDILTRRGTIPWRSVVVGDYVRTHRNRWRKVTGKHVNASVGEHRYAVIVGEGGRLFGVTSDHLVWTAAGWVEVSTAAQEGLRVLSVPYTNNRSRSHRSVPFLLHENTMERDGGTTTPTGGFACGLQQAHTVCRPHRVVVQHDQSGRSKIRPLLGRQQDSLRVPVPLEVGEEARVVTTGICDSPQERGLYRRQAIEPSAFGVQEARPYIWAEGSGQGQSSCVLDVWKAPANEPIEVARRSGSVLQPRVRGRSDEGPGNVDLSPVRGSVHPQGVRGPKERRSFLLSDLLRNVSHTGIEDPCVRLLRKEVHAQGLGVEEVAVGQVLLLTGVLAVGSRLYDLTVEDDRSFIAAGMVVHNSNCRDHLFAKLVPPEVAEADLHGALLERQRHIRVLRKIKRTGHI